MRINTKIVLDWDLNVLERESYEYNGPVAKCKGSDSASTVRDKEMAMQQQAFDSQQKQLTMLNTKLSPYLSGTNGFSPQAMSGMTSQFLNSNNSTYNQAGQQVREALGARGNTGANPVGGDYGKGLSTLLGARAGSQSQGILGLQTQNAMQGQSNMFNAANILSGNAATQTGTQAVSGNAMSNALNQYMTSMNSGFGASFGKAFGSGLGTGMSAGVTGGIGTAMSNVGNGNYGW
jgi:hypothetical protein